MVLKTDNQLLGLAWAGIKPKLKSTQNPCEDIQK